MENEKKQESFISIIDLWRLCVMHWKWFVISVAVCLAFAVRYLLTTPYYYSRQAAIMVREEVLGNNSSGRHTREFSEIEFVNQKGNLSNVERHILSLDVMMEVARQLDSTATEGVILDMAEGFQKRLSVEMAEKGSTIINLTYKDLSTSRAEQVLTLIIQVYDNKLMQEKYLATKHTSQFIDSRLRLLEVDLERVDDSISVFKSRYGITDLDRVSDIYLRQQSESDTEIMRLMSQKEMAGYILELLEDNSPKNQLLLTNPGITNSGIEAQITMYNNMVLELLSHMKYTSDQNPLIIHQQEQLANLRSKILANTSNYIHSIDIQLESLIDYHNEATDKVTSNPSQAKYLESIEREQKVKESLYLYLLQKKEENEISITHKSANIQIIDIPHGSGKPVSPKRLQTLIAALFLGLLIPVTILFLKATLDETVRDRFDVERNSDIPFLGEVPFSGKKTNLLYRLLSLIGLGRNRMNSDIVVGYGKQDPSNEAFRIIRTNLEFIAEEQAKTGALGKGMVYLIKSTQIGAGKTYISMNLALAMAIGNKRVLFIDSDLRDASASRQWKAPKQGLTDYLEGKCGDLSSLIFHIDKYPTLDILPSGIEPNNPTELLRSPLFTQLINKMRPLYDCIIIDSPSAGMLADADIIGKHVDCKLFIIRAGRFNRRNLDELKPVHHDDKQQYVVLNGVSIDSRYGIEYAHKYDRTEIQSNSMINKFKNILH